MQQLSNNLKNIRERIANAEHKYGRKPGSVELIAVSKEQAVEKLRVIAEQGLTHFGENYLQEALAKITELKPYQLEWHFLGPIQSNKTLAIAQAFQWIHSLDRIKIALRLNDQLAENSSPLNVLIQVNLDDEQTKSGVSLQALPSLIQSVAALPKLKLRGLMALPAMHDDFSKQRKSFQRLREIFENLQKTYSQLDSLSMGMSHDFEAAIAEGSTMVRIGTAIFGARNH